MSEHCCRKRARSTVDTTDAGPSIPGLWQPLTLSDSMPTAHLLRISALLFPALKFYFIIFNRDIIDK